MRVSIERCALAGVLVFCLLSVTQARWVHQQVAHNHQQIDRVARHIHQDNCASKSAGDRGHSPDDRPVDEGDCSICQMIAQWSPMQPASSEAAFFDVPRLTALPAPKADVYVGQIPLTVEARGPPALNSL